MEEFEGFWSPFQFFGAGGTIDIKGGGLRPSRAAYGFTFVSGFQNHVVAHAEVGRSSFVHGNDPPAGRGKKKWEATPGEF